MKNTQFHRADLDGLPKKSNKGQKIVFFHNFLQLLKNTLKNEVMVEQFNSKSA
jgi:hypothetical protein